MFNHFSAIRAWLPEEVKVEDETPMIVPAKRPDFSVGSLFVLMTSTNKN